MLARGRREKERERNWSSGEGQGWSLTSWVVVTNVDLVFPRAGDHTIKGLDTIHPLVF